MASTSSATGAEFDTGSPRGDTAAASNNLTQTSGRASKMASTSSATGAEFDTGSPRNNAGSDVVTPSKQSGRTSKLVSTSSATGADTDNDTIVSSKSPDRVSVAPSTSSATGAEFDTGVDKDDAVSDVGDLPKPSRRASKLASTSSVTGADTDTGLHTPDLPVSNHISDSSPEYSGLFESREHSCLTGSGEIDTFDSRLMPRNNAYGDDFKPDDACIPSPTHELSRANSSSSSRRESLTSSKESEAGSEIGIFNRTDYAAILGGKSRKTSIASDSPSTGTNEDVSLTTSSRRSSIEMRNTLDLGKYRVYILSHSHNFTHCRGFFLFACCLFLRSFFASALHYTVSSCAFA
jgi:hypothetical protein